MTGRGLPKSPPTNVHQVPPTAIRPGVQIVINGKQEIQEVDPKTIKSNRHRKTPKRSLWSKVE